MIDGHAVVNEIALAAPREAVFAMFVEPAQLVRWVGIAAGAEAVR